MPWYMSISAAPPKRSGRRTVAFQPDDYSPDPVAQDRRAMEYSQRQRMGQVPGYARSNTELVSGNTYPHAYVSPSDTFSSTGDDGEDDDDVMNVFPIIPNTAPLYTTQSEQDEESAAYLANMMGMDIEDGADDDSDGSSDDSDGAPDDSDGASDDTDG